MTHIAMTIGGSDSCGGAGVQGDIKTLSALGVYATSVVTALTAQNSLVVAGIHPAPPDFVALQIDTVLEDMPVCAVKTGMLFSASIIEAVADSLARHDVRALVVDPVMTATTGASLLEPDAVKILKQKLAPMAIMITPNMDEAAILADMEVNCVDDMKLAAKKISELGPAGVLVKGGHMQGDQVTDVLWQDGDFTLYRRERANTRDTHGSGCALASAITAGLARGVGLAHALELAQRYIQTAIQTAIPLGRGDGPVNHLWPVRLKRV